MTSLTGRAPYSKESQPKAKTRKGVRQISAKKAARKATEKADGAWEHMARVKELPCLVCGVYGVEVHHEGFPRSDWNVLPLCPPHHRREFGPQAYHYSKRNFYALHGKSEELLAKVAKILDK